MKHSLLYFMNHTLRLSLAFFIAFIGYCAPGVSQNTITQTIRGVVSDGDNNQRLAGASVKLVGTETGTIPDSIGNFRLINIPIGRYSLQISC
jgi:hypothetical protein